MSPAGSLGSSGNSGITMDSQERATLISDLQLLWHGHSDLRFGQMLRRAVGDPAVRSPNGLMDATIVAGVRVALRDAPGFPPPPGPYWDTEARDGRTFMSGLPRDPARIRRVLAALAAAWDAHPSLRLGQVIELAFDRAGISDNEYGSRLLLIEDGPLRRMLRAVVADPGRGDDAR